MKIDALSPLVSVYCMTYNHKDTIEETVMSIVNQKTDFPFELIIHDDASTDGTTQLVLSLKERYPNIIVPIIQKENQFYNCNIVKTYINPIARGKYVAICEGDDFWKSEDKLQKQVDFLENNPDCCLVFHAVDQAMSDGKKMSVRPLKKSGFVPIEKIIRRGGLFCPSASLVFRRDVMEFYPDFRLAADVYDYPAQILAATMGKVYYLDENMAVYRFASQGSWTAQREETADIEHLKNEKKWLSLFNDYSNGKYQSSVDFHLAHLYFTQWRKTFDKELKKQTRMFVKKLPILEKITFSCAIVFFSMFGNIANKMFSAVKKQLLK